MIEPLLSVDDVATILGIKRDTVYKLISRNDLPGFKVGRLWKFKQNELDAWMNKQPGRRRPRKRSHSGHRRGA